MGQRASKSRRRTGSSGVAGPAASLPEATPAAPADAAQESKEEPPPAEPPQPKLPFRCEDRSAIPDDLVDGPFEEFEIAEDVYATAYLIARNSGNMYSIWPWKNPDVAIVWTLLLFIAGSQLFVILSVTVWYPHTVKTDSLLLVCSNATSVTSAFAQKFLTVDSSEACVEEGVFAFEADVRGELMRHYRVERNVFFYDSILKEGDATVYLLRFICCIWVFSQIYLQGFASIRNLIQYHDFSLWFLPLKGEGINNSWAIGIPMIQYFVLLVVATVSFVIICAQAEAFDIVMNSLAFTFIAEVGSYFNGPLVKRMSATLVKDLPPEEYPSPIFYSYPQYDVANAVNDDGTYTDGGWYILEEEEKAGLLSDYRVKHNPAKYRNYHGEIVGRPLEWALFIVPVTVVAFGTLRCHGYLEGGAQMEL